MTKRIHNFSAGPAALPEEVLVKAQADFLSYQGEGMSIMEMSHRSKTFLSVTESARDRVRQLLSVPDTYEILFLQGGASTQFSMVPLNLMGASGSADLLQTGSWTKKATKEIQRVGNCRIVASSEDKNFSYIPSVEGLDLDSEADFVYCSSNNTIFGTQFKAFPQTGSVPLVADMSSDILSRPLDVSQFGVIFAGAQKNLGPSGVTLVILRRDLADRCPESLASMLQYRTHIKGESMYNTPPTFAIYMVGLVLEWLENQGGLAAMKTRNDAKAARLYDAIDNLDFYYSPTEVGSRSPMNVVFRVTGDHEDLEAQFVKEASAQGLSGLKGHRSVGGLRASIYNACPDASVDALIEFMHAFSKANAHVQSSQSSQVSA